MDMTEFILPMFSDGNASFWPRVDINAVYSETNGAKSDNFLINLSLAVSSNERSAKFLKRLPAFYKLFDYKRAGFYFN